MSLLEVEGLRIPILPIQFMTRMLGQKPMGKKLGL